MTTTIQPAAALRNLDDLEVEGRRTFVRVDFNVPLDDGGSITDDSRIKAALDTIENLRNRGARLVLASHLGRPKGERRAEFSLEPVGVRLAELLDQEILFPDDCIGDGPKKLVRDLRGGQVVLLENLRYHSGETAGDDGFARQLAELADVYVNDAFGAAHRAHASVVGVPQHVEDKAAGLLLAREVEALTALLSSPEAPFVAILGGAKVSDKIAVVESLLEKAQILIVGGAMAYTFLASQGHDMGDSLVETEQIELARKLLLRARNRGVHIALPVDHIAAAAISPEAERRTVPNGSIPSDWKAVDIGPETIDLFTGHIESARTLFWNGPMGIFEIDAFAQGTQRVARSVAASSATSVVGGGDSVAAVHKAGVAPFVSHISTGGGASLEFMEGRVLPGIKALCEVI